MFKMYYYSMPHTILIHWGTLNANIINNVTIAPMFVKSNNMVWLSAIIKNQHMTLIYLICAHPCSS